MWRPRLFVSLAIMCFLCVELTPQATGAQPTVPQFQIGKFTVFVNLATVTVDGRPLAPQPWPRPESPFGYTGKKFAGKGRIVIRSASVEVSFRDVTLAPDTQNNSLLSISGIVSGIAVSGAPSVKYELEAFPIEIRRASIQLTPTSATAAVIVTIKLESFSRDSGSSLTISSNSCSIAPDGSILGDNFHGVGSFMLKDSVYSLECRQNDVQTVRIGPSFTPQGPKPPLSGTQLCGAASKDNVVIFTFRGTVNPAVQGASFTLDLADALDRKPESGYDLRLKAGTVTYRYRQGGLQNCEGVFAADLGLPLSVPDESNRRIILKDIILKTDKTGALFNNVSLPQRLKVGYDNADLSAVPIYFVEAAESDSAWAYFPDWQSQTSHSSYPYEYKPDKSECENQFRFLDPQTPGAERYNVHGRPGVTVTHGILYFYSPQVKTKDASTEDAHRLKTPFRGGLTLTLSGITGELTSGGNSFIPVSQNISISALPTPSPQSTWQQILDMGDQKPNEPTERFQLAELRILEMQIAKALFCSNKLYENKFRYKVHFPYPSFIDLEFEDNSLNDKGLLNLAKGPVATQSQSLEGDSNSQATSGQPIRLSKLSKPNPDTHILWFWRLPVSFADRGVTINYPSASAKADVTVVKVDPPSDSGVTEVLSSEIWLRPLYSKRSAIKSGVRFSAKLDPGGMFRLTAWDRSPILSKMYAKPNTERSAGFETKLNNISLADLITNPKTRKVDFSWDGTITFPFFGSQNANFNIRNLYPILLNPTSMAAEKARSYTNCTGQPEVESGGEDSTKRLRIQVQNLQYIESLNRFASATIPEAKKIENDQEKALDAIYLDMTSFTNGLLTTSRNIIKELPVNPPGVPPDQTWTVSPGSCGRTPPKQVRQIMTDALASDSFVDLVCYDLEARNVRGILGACCNTYYFGTYRFQTRNGSTEPAKDVLVLPNVKYYPNVSPVKLEVNGAEMSLQSDEADNPRKTVINIPSAQLAFTGLTTIEGAFGATLATVAEDLPYEGDLRFALDTQCGYFYLQGAGSFTYFFRFSGQTFIVHAPYNRLTSAPPFPWVTNILEELSIRALFDNPRDFKKWTQLDTLESTPNTVITGVLTTGNVGWAKSIGVLNLDLRAGPGLYVFQFKAGGQTSYKIGTFLNARANADVGYKGVTIGVESNDTYGGTIATNPFEAMVSGTLNLEGCASVYLGHCQGIAKVGVSLSSKKGFDFHDPGFDGDCGTGGCP